MDPITALLSDEELFKKYYPEYLFRKELTRRFVVDTNNLILDIETGEGSALEPFKLAHRGIDVQKAQEKKEKIRLENQRLRELIANNRLEDRYWAAGEQKYIILDRNNVIPSALLREDQKVESVIKPAAKATNYLFGSVQSENNKPITGAKLIVAPGDYEHNPFEETSESSIISSTISSPNGLFSFNLELGEYTIVASARGFTPQSQSVTISTEEPSEVTFNLKRKKSKRIQR